MLKGTNIVLRAVDERDLDMILRLSTLPANWRLMMTPFFTTRDELQQWYQELRTRRDRVAMMIETFAGQTVGVATLEHIDWRNQECEGAQLIIDPEARKRGYAEEAIRLIVRYAFEELNLHRMYVYCYSFNEAVHLIKRLGFREEGVLRKAVFAGGKYHDKILLALLREEWDADKEPANVPDAATMWYAGDGILVRM